MLQNVTEKVLDAVRRLRTAKARRGNCGRQRKRGRPRKGAQKRLKSKGPTNKEQAAFVFKHRYLIVKRPEKLTEQEREDLKRMFSYQPAQKTLWQLCQEAYKLWSVEQSRQVAKWRWTRPKNPSGS